MLRALPFVIFTSSVAHADAVAYSCGRAPNVTLSNRGAPCAGFTAHDAPGHEVSKGSLDFRGSGEFLESDPMSVDDSCSSTTARSSRATRSATCWCAPSS